MQDLDDLAAALGHVGARVDQVGRPAADSLLVRPGPGGPAVAVRVRGAARADPARVARLVEGDRAGGRAGAVTVVVADLVPDRSRDLLRAAGWGWFDRRGSLRVQAPGLVIDTRVPAAVRPAVTGRPAISGRGGTTWAAALLLEAGRAPVLREVARRSGLAPSTLAAAGRPVRQAGLVDTSGRGRLPELFWALAEAWRPAWTPVATVPPGGAAGAVTAGWEAARLHGAPVGALTDEPADAYVETPDELARVVRECRRCHPELAAARVAVAPTPLVLSTAMRESGAAPGGLVVHPLFAALDLADRPGGADVLARWQPEWIR
jgi:hypothetical protein